MRKTESNLTFWDSNLSFVLLIVMIALSCITFFVDPLIIFYSFFLIITIPIIPLVLVAPSFLLYYGAAYFSAQIFGGWKGAFVGLSCTLLICAIPPFQVNRWLEKRAQELIAGDISIAPNTFHPRTLAIYQVKNGSDDKQALCDEVCMRL